MQTSLALARAQVRHGWRDLAGIVVLVVLIVVLVLGDLAGAKRTRTAIDRMIDDNEMSDVTVNPDASDESVLDFDLIAALPMVAQFSWLHGAFAVPSGEITLDNLFSAPFTRASDGHVLVVGVTVANVMVIAVRRRRRDIAILQSIGSTRANVTAVGVWQGITIGVTALLSGVPLGVATGRWFWSQLANGFGAFAEPFVPLPGLVGVVVMLAAISEFVPIRAGLRHRPARVLHSE